MTTLNDYAAEPPPKGWEPYSEQMGQIGQAIVRLPKPNATVRDLLIVSGFNPDEWTIDGEINVRRWMRYDQEWLYYYKFNVKAGESAEAAEFDVEDLVRSLREHRIPWTIPHVPITGNDAFVFCASDWQIGKREGNVGTPDTVKRVTDAVDQAVARVINLRKIGRRMPQGALLATGDIGEGTCGFYPGQQFLIDCNRRDQNRISRSLITYAIDSLAPLFDEFVVATVGGNHGENREDGSRVTNDGDNDDVAVFETVREAFDRSGHPSNISWIIPDDELSLGIDLGGIKVGLTHGHLFKSGGKMAQAKALEWWKGQTFGMQAVTEAKILISSHFHHLSVIDHGGRTHIQTPAADPGSKWVRESRGADSAAGILTLRVDSLKPLGFGDLEVI